MFHLEQFADYGLLFLRLMVGLIYADSGYNTFKDPDARSKSIELPKPLTIVVGVVELAGGLAVIVGVLPQLAAVGLIFVMLGAIQKKVFVWKTGFWGKDGLGWYYDSTLISALTVILFTDGGRFVLVR